jgi:hypothetical protein
VLRLDHKEELSMPVSRRQLPPAVASCIHLLILVPDDLAADGLRADREFSHGHAHQRIKDRQYIRGESAGLIGEKLWLRKKERNLIDRNKQGRKERSKKEGRNERV